MREEVGINLTPLIDVVFLLLIFFMVSTTFTRETQLSVDLPEAQGQPSQAMEKSIEILVDESGIYRINGEALIDNNMRTLQAAIYKISAGDNTMPMSIRAEPLLRYFHGALHGIHSSHSCTLRLEPIARETPARYSGKNHDPKSVGAGRL